MLLITIGEVGEFLVENFEIFGGSVDYVEDGGVFGFIADFGLHAEDFGNL